MKICIWIYYAGHGVMDNMNYIVLNEKSNIKRFFPLEEKINKLTESCKNTCAFVIWDCCREEMTKKEMKEATL